MRYIRTKDGIHQCRVGFEDWEKGHDEIKSAYTMEELFDVIVAVPHNLEKPMLGRIEVPASGGIEYPMFLNQKTGWYHDLYSFVGVYGAIWVINESGIPTLKPVAKLNKNGRFELL